MYIKKYWGNFIGGSDDSLNLMAFLEDQKQEEIPLSEIFAKIGLDKQNWDFRQTVEYLEFTHSDGVEMDFHFAIDVVTDLAAILLECSVSGSVNLQDLDEYNTPRPPYPHHCYAGGARGHGQGPGGLCPCPAGIRHQRDDGRG